MKFLLSRRGCEIVDPTRDALRRTVTDLTVSPSPTPFDPRPRKICMYEANGSRVPIQYAKTAFPDATYDDQRTTNPLPPHRLAFAGSLRESQCDPVVQTLDSLRTRGGAILCLPTGEGKTACALYIAAALRVKTIVVVHKQFLADQWIDRIRAFLPGTSTSKIQGQSMIDTSGDIVVAMVQTLVSRDFPKETFESFDLLIFDECHHVAAEKFGRCMRFLQCPYTLGLSATPHRKDGLDALLHWTLGPIAHQKTMKNRRDVSVEAVRYMTAAYRNPQPTNVRGTVDSTAVVSRLAEDPARLEAVLRVITAIDAERYVLVLSHRRAHCQAIVAGLRGRGVEDVGLCIGKIRDTTPRILVATYALVSEGFDKPRLDTLVLATPASDVTQAVGRILRSNAASRNPVIYDIVDEWGSCFAQFIKRRGQYRKSGFLVKP